MRTQNPFVISAFIFIVALIFSVLYVLSRSFKAVTPDKEQVLGITIAFTTLLFGLLLGFTVSNFWQKFIEVNESIIAEVQGLLRMIRIAKDYPGTEDLINAVRAYAYDTLYYEWPNLQEGKSEKFSDRNEEAFRKIISTMNAYAISHPLNNETDILYSLIPPREKLKTFINKNANQKLFYFNVSCAVITIISFWFLRIGNTLVQIIVDATMISIIVISVYILYEFYNEFSGIFQVEISSFETILNEPIPFTPAPFPPLPLDVVDF